MAAISFPKSTQTFRKTTQTSLRSARKRETKHRSKPNAIKAISSTRWIQNPVIKSGVILPHGEISTDFSGKLISEASWKTLRL